MGIANRVLRLSRVEGSKKEGTLYRAAAMAHW